MTEEREGIYKFIEDTTLKVASILGDNQNSKWDWWVGEMFWNQSNRICQYNGSSKHRILQEGKKMKHVDAEQGLCG